MSPPVTSVPPLAPQAVHVWRIPLHVSPECRAACQALLSADELARAARFHFPEHQRRYTVARGFLRSLLECYLEGMNAAQLRFTYGPAGKPALDGLHFNVAHSSDWALIAVAKGQAVGVDLEQVRMLDYAAVGRHVLAAEDLMALTRAPAEQKAAAFFRLWTRHEARLKAAGAALGQPARPEIQAYDLDAPPTHCAALATLITRPEIRLLDAGAA